MGNITVEHNNEINLKELIVPHTAFSSGCFGSNNQKIFYISDIHLLHHLGRDGAIYYSFKQKGIVNIKYWDLVKKRIKLIVNNLFNQGLSQDIINCECPIVLFGGDTSSDTDITKYFYHYFKIRYMYYKYKLWRAEHCFEPPLTELQAKKQYKNKLFNLQKLYNEKIEQLCQWGVDYRKTKRKLSNWNLSSFISKNSLPQFIEYRIETLRHIEYKIYSLKSGQEEFIQHAKLGAQFKKPNLFPIFVVLGNHELVDFSSVEIATNYFEKFFSDEKIIFLNNKCGTYKGLFSIVGGIGFAKYNNRYNAQNIITTTPPISRENEIIESDKFFEVYNKAVIDCKKNFRHLIVLSHYPVNDWCNQGYNSICTYFTGHTHRNDSIHTQKVNVYADNQIGYRTKNIKFKTCTLGLLYNPFFEYGDGYYEITTNQYEKFLRYRGENIKGTGLIDNMLVKGNAKLYMVKQNSFYGFFLINENTGTYICCGGVPKKISKIIDINYFCGNFKKIISKYIYLILPLRKTQNQISQELQQMGFSGEIHGLIVDVDFYHHIIINPFDGKLAFYYSPYLGVVQQFGTIKELLSHIEIANLDGNGFSKLQIDHKIINNHDLLSPILTNNKGYLEKIVKIDIKNSEYKISRWVKQIQRLFSSNILRVWDDELIKNFLPKSSSGF